MPVYFTFHGICIIFPYFQVDFQFLDFKILCFLYIPQLLGMRWGAGVISRGHCQVYIRYLRFFGKSLSVPPGCVLPPWHSKKEELLNPDARVHRWTLSTRKSNMERNMAAADTDGSAQFPGYPRAARLSVRWARLHSLALQGRRVTVSQRNKVEQKTWHHSSFPHPNYNDFSANAKGQSSVGGRLDNGVALVIFPERLVFRFTHNVIVLQIVLVQESEKDNTSVYSFFSVADTLLSTVHTLSHIIRSPALWTQPFLIWQNWGNLSEIPWLVNGREVLNCPTC